MQKMGGVCNLGTQITVDTGRKAKSYIDQPSYCQVCCSGFTGQILIFNEGSGLYIGARIFMAVRNS